MVMVTSLIDLLSTLTVAGDEHDLASTLAELLSLTSATSYFFVLTQAFVGTPRTDVRFLIGCDPRLSQSYAARHWHLVDPYFNHCATSNSPIAGNGVVASTGGQRDVLVAFQRNGYLSSLAVPAHGAYLGHKAMLLVGNDRQKSDGEAALQREAGLFRAICASLLDRMLSFSGTEAAQDHNLDRDDLIILRLLARDTTTAGVAEALGITVAATYKRFQTINKKLSIPRISEAVAWAQANAIL